MKFWLLCESDKLEHIIRCSNNPQDFKCLLNTKSNTVSGFYNRLYKSDRWGRTIKSAGEKYKMEEIEIMIDDDDLEFALKYGLDYLFDNFSLIELSKYLDVNLFTIYKKFRHKQMSFFKEKIKEKLCKKELTFEEM